MKFLLSLILFCFHDRLVTIRDLQRVYLLQWIKFCNIHGDQWLFANSIFRKPLIWRAVPRVHPLAPKFFVIFAVPNVIIFVYSPQFNQWNNHSFRNIQVAFFALKYFSYFVTIWNFRKVPGWKHYYLLFSTILCHCHGAAKISNFESRFIPSQKKNVAYQIHICMWKLQLKEFFTNGKKFASKSVKYQDEYKAYHEVSNEKDIKLHHSQTVLFKFFLRRIFVLFLFKTVHCFSQTSYFLLTCRLPYFFVWLYVQANFST